MARRVIVEMIDDLDGSVGEDVETVSFALDGHRYEIDLSGRNARKLRETIAEFISASRRLRSGRGPAPVKTRRGATVERAATVDQAAKRQRVPNSSRPPVAASTDASTKTNPNAPSTKGSKSKVVAPKLPVFSG